jgi:hypothetical protein
MTLIDSVILNSTTNLIGLAFNHRRITGSGPAIGITQVIIHNEQGRSRTIVGKRHSSLQSNIYFNAFLDIANELTSPLFLGIQNGLYNFLDLLVCFQNAGTVSDIGNRQNQRLKFIRVIDRKVFHLLEKPTEQRVIYSPTIAEPTQVRIGITLENNNGIVFKLNGGHILSLL